MNSLYLLTKGRTFKDMADRHGAYKLAHGALPKFTAGRQLPFAEGRGPSAEMTHSAPPVARTSLFEPSTEAVKATIVDAHKEEVESVVPVIPPEPAVSKSPFAQVAKTSEKVHVASLWQRIARFCKRLVQRHVFGRKGRPVHGSTVQTELALEKVTVLKNDLNEDDLEVVLVERKVGTGEKPLARLSKLEMTGEAWIRLTAPFRKKHGEIANSSKAETTQSPGLSAPV